MYCNTLSQQAVIFFVAAGVYAAPEAEADADALYGYYGYGHLGYAHHGYYGYLYAYHGLR